MKMIRSFLGLLALVSAHAYAGVTDTGKILRQLADNMKDADELVCTYTMDAKFPNGDKDHLAGNIYVNMQEKLYYNDCNMYTMVYTPHWFYRADHMAKTVSVIDLSREKDKKQKKERERSIFQNNMLATFLDSFLLKKASIKELRYENGRYMVSAGFPNAPGIRRLTVTYDTANNLPISCTSLIMQPMATPKGVQQVSINTTYSDFKKVKDISAYQEDVFFTYAKNNVVLKKYNTYKLIRKI